MEVGCAGMMMPDHVPKISGDQKSYQVFVYTFGHFKALIAVVNFES